MNAVLVTPLPPQPTGLADYARRIIHLTEKKVEWKIAYSEGGAPVPEAECLPISKLNTLPGSILRVYQIGNSLHCAEVINAMMEQPGHALFHETNLHHVLRQIADSTGDWKTYEAHVRSEYGPSADTVLQTMGRKAESLSEYDMRLRRNHLAGLLPSVARKVAVLSDTAGMTMEKLLPGKKIYRMGFLADFLDRVEKPAGSEEETVIGIAGTFHYGRNWESMLEAVALLRRHYSVKLLVVGAGWPETGHEWVHVTGRLNDLEFRKALERIDVAIDLRHHTCSETSGSMMDVMRSGIPAVLSDQGSFRDLPSDAVVRIPCDSGVAGAEAALRFLLDNRDIMKATGENARKYFLRVSDPDVCLSQWMDFLDEN
ncbi:hypothetical protein CSA37_05070 [Candidatus Fermentibacteria bacterium]|nr:MAG: hypothetical protein CSA37_10360 [Candidatus Fermentibacteria bacterium]PIE52300.1 MAG: hypothetical protein CSA37_07465 [Candidatus Fermentibacteria bacterium]PIE52795.1 MAG: hypothetical protein CSA37_05070 [Candidatus Fermentibacteria bacterium]